MDVSQLTQADQKLRLAAWSEVPDALERGELSREEVERLKPLYVEAV